MISAQGTRKPYSSVAHTIVAIKEKGAVVLSWTLQELVTELHMQVREQIKDPTVYQGLTVNERGDVQVKKEPLTKVFEILFEYTPEIAEAKLCECRFELTHIVQGRQANLKNFNLAAGEFSIIIPLHNHLFGELRVSVSPTSGLLRARNTLFDAIDPIRKYLYSLVEPVKTEDENATRAKKQRSTIGALLNKVPHATSGEMVVLGIQGIIQASKRKGIQLVWPNMVQKYLLKLRPKEFPSESAFAIAVAKAEAEELIECWRPTNVMTPSRISLTIKGREWLENLLKT